MTLPALPADQSTDWYGYASALDSTVRGLVAGGAGSGVITDSAGSYFTGPRFCVTGPTDWRPTPGASARQIVIAAGTGRAGGVPFTTTAPVAVTTDANTGTLNRYDLVVARWTWTVDSSSGDLTVSRGFAVVKGTANAAPPTTRQLAPGVLYEGLVSIVAVRPSVGTFLTADVIDMRVWPGGAGVLTKPTGDFLDYLDVQVGLDLLVLNNLGMGWQRFWHDGLIWHGTREISFQTTAFTATVLTSANGTSPAILATVAPPAVLNYPHRFEPTSSTQVAANTGTPGELNTWLDGVGNVPLSAAAIRSASFPDGELLAMALTPYEGPVITGYHSVLLVIYRHGGSGNVAVNALGNVLNVKVKPA